MSRLKWERIEEHPDSPVEGDVIMYRDGKIAVVGNASQVSYGPRSEMQTVARLYPRPTPAAGEEQSVAEHGPLCGFRSCEHFQSLHRGKETARGKACVAPGCPCVGFTVLTEVQADEQ